MRRRPTAGAPHQASAAAISTTFSTHGPAADGPPWQQHRQRCQCLLRLRRRKKPRPAARRADEVSVGRRRPRRQQRRQCLLRLRRRPAAAGAGRRRRPPAAGLQAGVGRSRSGTMSCTTGRPTAPSGTVPPPAASTRRRSSRDATAAPEAERWEERATAGMPVAGRRRGDGPSAREAPSHRSPLRGGASRRQPLPEWNSTLSRIAHSSSGRRRSATHARGRPRGGSAERGGGAGASYRGDTEPGAQRPPPRSASRPKRAARADAAVVQRFRRPASHARRRIRRSVLRRGAGAPCAA